MCTDIEQHVQVLTILDVHEVTVNHVNLFD